MTGGVVCAVDVGTRSARAGIIGVDGALLGRGERPIAINEPKPGFAEHDSEDIWRAVCAAVKDARSAAKVEARDIAGISFDATCSLVVRDHEARPLSVSTDGEGAWDTIVWLDHRALAEADECTATGHRVLDYAGGVMSPEMAVPKLMWIKRHLPKVWARTGYLFDLADYLTWRASGSLARSQCTLTCKWTFLAHEHVGWQRDFFQSVGIADAIERGKLPESASAVGSDLGRLLPEAAAALGLDTNCRVVTGLIDAYAGALGVLGAHAADLSGVGRHMGLIAGTSSCVMTIATEAQPLAGFWGPYLGAALPGLWMSEGGQSATGALLDHIIRLHSAGGEPNAALHEKIARRVSELRIEEGTDFAARLHVLPDFHGNRSPLGNPHALGVISGLTLDVSFDGLCRVYWRCCVGIALGVRHILDTLNADGFGIDTLHVTGGHTKNHLLMQLYADATGCTVSEPLVDEAVLLGTGMVAAFGAGLFPTLAAACLAMQQPGRQLLPNTALRAAFDRDYRVFLEMQRQRASLDLIA